MVHSFASLDEALLAHDIPAENHALIHHLAERFGFSDFRSSGQYFTAARYGSRTRVRIAYGYTSGFEQHELAPVENWDGQDAPVRRSEVSPDLWLIKHPSRAHEGSRRTARQPSPPVATEPAEQERAPKRRVAAAKPATALTRTARAPVVERAAPEVCDRCWTQRSATGSCACD